MSQKSSRRQGRECLCRITAIADGVRDFRTASIFAEGDPKNILHLISCLNRRRKSYRIPLYGVWNRIIIRIIGFRHRFRGKPQPVPAVNVPRRARIKILVKSRPAVGCGIPDIFKHYIGLAVKLVADNVGAFIQCNDHPADLVRHFQTASRANE